MCIQKGRVQLRMHICTLTKLGGTLGVILIALTFFFL